MLNWADLSALLTVLAGPLSGGIVAHEHQKGMGVAVLLILGGLLLGFGVSWVCSRLAYFILASKRLPDLVLLVLYMVVPMVGLGVVVAVPAWLGVVIWSGC